MKAIYSLLFLFLTTSCGGSVSGLTESATTTGSNLSDASEGDLGETATPPVDVAGAYLTSVVCGADSQLEEKDGMFAMGCKSEETKLLNEKFEAYTLDNDGTKINLSLLVVEGSEWQVSFYYPETAGEYLVIGDARTSERVDEYFQVNAKEGKVSDKWEKIQKKNTDAVISSINCKRNLEAEIIMCTSSNYLLSPIYIGARIFMGSILNKDVNIEIQKDRSKMIIRNPENKISLLKVISKFSPGEKVFDFQSSNLNSESNRKRKK